MEDPSKSTVKNDIETLCNGIKNKYRQYHLADRDRFPAFDYNTNRANYEPLRESFDEEFYVIRGLDRANSTIHIPSTNTLALLFSGDGYLPKGKILNTCRSYAEGRTQNVANPTVSSTSSGTQTTRVKAGKLFLLGGFIFLVGILIYVAFYQLLQSPRPSGFSVNRPHPGEHSPRLLTVEGKVMNADTVWIVVRPSGWGRNYIPPMGWDKYYVQPPIKVNDDGIWRGQVYIGSENGGEIGVKYQIRAFVNPDKAYKVMEGYDEYIFDSWPDAQLSTEAIEVIR